MLAHDSYHVGPSGRLYNKQQDIQAQTASRERKNASPSTPRFLMSDQRIRIFDGVAVVTSTGRSMSTLPNGTSQLGNPFRVVHVWEKRDGRWLLIVDQVPAVS